MSIGFTFGSLINDQSTLMQDDDIDVFLTGTQLDGLVDGFENFLSGLGLSTAQKAFAVDVDGGSSSSLITVTATPDEQINDLKLVADPTTASGWTTLGGAPLYLHVDPTGNYATLTTVTGDGGDIYAAFALTNEVIDNVAHTASAGVQMLTFAPIHHPDATLPDERLPLGDVLRVAADTAISFDFHQLAAGNFLWAAVGSGGGAMLITGQDLNVIDAGAKLGDKVNSGSSDPTDTVNTSKATETTIGINAQHFAPTNGGNGPTAIMTFVSGFRPLTGATPQYTGQNITQIDYADYINVGSASVFVSQLTGGTSAKIQFSLLEAGGGPLGSGDHLTTALRPEEGYSSPSVVDPFSYIGNQDSDSNLKDDWGVTVATVTVRGFTWDLSTSGSLHNGVRVTFDPLKPSNVVVEGAAANDTVLLTAANDPANPLDGTFNRIAIQALSGSAAFDIGHIDLTQGGQTSAGLGSHLFLDDDAPTLVAGVDNDLVVANLVGASDDSSFGVLAGTDGMQSFTFVGDADIEGALQWRYNDSSHTSITGTYNDASGQTDLYTLVLSADGSYDFDMIGVLPGGKLDLNPAEVIKAGAPDAPILEIGAKDSDAFVRMSAGGGNINESHGVVGVTNGNLDYGESLTFTLWEGSEQLTFEGIQIGTKSAQGGYYSFTYHIVGEPDDAPPHVGEAMEYAVKNGVIDIQPEDVDFQTIDRITITKETGSAIKIGIADIHIITPPDDVQLGFNVMLVDGDGDSAPGSFLVDIDGANDGSPPASLTTLAAATSFDATGADSLLGKATDSYHSHDYFLV